MLLLIVGFYLLTCEKDHPIIGTVMMVVGIGHIIGG
jgi:hypothetical protein